MISPPVLAAYSPPLNHVRIDADTQHHTVSWVTATVDRQTDQLNIQLTGMGAQYTMQAERSSGLGIQFSVAGGPTDLTVSLLREGVYTAPTDTQGLWLGGQLRAYYMLWQSKPPEGQRPSALTMFANVRGLYYHTQGPGTQNSVLADARIVTGGLGAMAEITLNRYLSLAPYAWITPDIYSETNYSQGTFFVRETGSFSLRRPLLVGTDIWFYTNPNDWNRRISLSFLLSLIDTEGKNDRIIAGVIGYTF